MAPTSRPDNKKLRSIAHKLHPIVTVAGKGLTDNVLGEIERALTQHELIKIRVLAEDRPARRELIDTICRSSEARLVQRIGNAAVLYRASAEPDPRLSNILRAGKQ